MNSRRSFIAALLRAGVGAAAFGVAAWRANAEGRPQVDAISRQMSNRVNKSDAVNVHLRGNSGRLRPSERIAGDLEYLSGWHWSSSTSATGKRTGIVPL